MNKKKVFYDERQVYDEYSIKKHKKDNIVTVTCHETGEVLFKGTNKVTVAGSAFLASKMWNIKPKAWTPSYNTELGLENTVTEPYEGIGIRKEEQICLFAVGIDGCGKDPSQVYPVKYADWIAPEYLVPFRYQLLTNDLSDYQRTKYFGRKIKGDRIAYYFKTPETPVDFKQQYVDGTPIDENIYVSSRQDEVESYGEMKLAVTKEDLRDFFLTTTGIETARINSLSILTAWKTTVDGVDYYQDIRPLTVIHFPNESLIDTSKGLDITYQIFS